MGSPALRVAEGKKPVPPEKEHSERKKNLESLMSQLKKDIFNKEGKGLPHQRIKKEE